MGCAMSLVALGIGYLVLLNANKEKEGLKLLGQAIGIIILVGALMTAVCAATKCMKGGACGMGEKKMCHTSASGAPMCPVSGKSTEAEEK